MQVFLWILALNHASKIYECQAFNTKVNKRQAFGVSLLDSLANENLG